MEQPLILVVDDDPDLAQLLAIQLNTEGYRTQTAHDGKTAIEVARSISPDLIILDVTMPLMSGYETCSRIREFSKAPIIMLTARVKDLDAAEGLDSGADDYVTKPHSPVELMARIRALLRRVPPAKAVVTAGGGIVQFDRERRELKVEDKLIPLTPTEYELLSLLAENVGKVVQHETLLSKVWSADATSSHDSLKVYIWHLRGKLEKDPKNPKILVTDWGVGYKLVE